MGAFCKITLTSCLSTGRYKFFTIGGETAAALSGTAFYVTVCILWVLLLILVYVSFYLLLAWTLTGWLCEFHQPVTFVILSVEFSLKGYSVQKNERAKTIIVMQCHCKLNLFLCGKKTIFIVFILECAEYELLVYLLYDCVAPSIEFFIQQQRCKQN